ncbi:PREDICTED: centromere protein K-like isoform X1 [Poecilia mexicana]|uniref:centromere protein K-like isoform X1 n=1 Tax=Poecilia mexicana TaxID=48701 RepID=UPI00072DF12B|nr:PREDICTED: centromere protein K-like isoform X1 [Poecilia mexicana]XP_014834701.1 PREDICTED: centromere protein K-like isoform X1 [Poecilia mexicana]XP_014868678.1 PREDICTED: centromere protein K-like isoform X1 [Poecilia mexicana]XP_014868679.1 PREDICTED: centromere protein K-like isoform X1 [Poecilia mexicana]XP_016521634.1 PREDICTED: centromere protein K-like isoform X1 [Poecilia formosa]XP_016521639.1 PREDICTED: centromere protein K-like isoform X1 [Poecilia formosa]XP_016521878.1 PRED
MVRCDPGEVRADRRAAGQLSEAAESELVQQCEEQFAQLEKLQNEIILCEPDICENHQEQSVSRLAATDAELKLWMSMQPSSLAANAEILLHAGKDEMLKLCSELEMVVSCCEAKRDKLRETKELEQKWLEEKKQVLLAANDHIERLRVEKEKYSEHNILLETKAKIQKMKAYQEQLMESLGDILEKHVPLPQDESTASKKKKNIPLKISEDLVSLSKILEVLMDKVMNTPHDPYVTIDHTFWPPYVEMLLRYGIAVRHQENNFKIRLETFF